MLKIFMDFLSGWKMTLLGGLFLAASFILPVYGYAKMQNLAFVCIFISGLPLLYLSAYRIIYNRGISKISSALLISMAMLAAIFIGDLFAAGEVAFIMAVGALLEDMTTSRAQKGLKKLITVTPQRGNLIKDGQVKTVNITEIRRGDKLRIFPGETIPVDGVIIDGESSVDQSVMTGESLPVDKKISDKVFSGTLNQYGSIDIEATKTGEDSSIQKLVRLVRNSANKQASTQRTADLWASWLVPLVLIIAVLTYFITGEIVRAVTVMVVFCPCALVLATPTAIMAAIGQATKHGVIIKSGEALEQMGKVKNIAFDKTGTITRGTLEVTDVVSLCELNSEMLLALIASAESKSEHPLARAVVKKAKEKSLSLYDVSDFEMTAGRGIKARVNGKSYVIGNEQYLQSEDISISVSARENLNKLRAQGKACLIVAEGQHLMGIVGLGDSQRQYAKEMVDVLSSMKTDSVLLTGDNSKAASFWGKKVGISNIKAELLPEQKVLAIEQLKSYGKVCMIGDGVNDAPALRKSDVGIAMGAMGSDLAIEVADIALMTDDLSKIPYLKWLSVETIRTINFAITLSMLINFIAVLLSVYGLLTPTSGAVVHNVGSCLVVLLAALLYDRKYKRKDEMNIKKYTPDTDCI
ncbi:heavy metal translocating P-type ATPase [Succinivibrio dextrinosolvens]|uniref:heavy metal translocating P-type ATPase n=1 Tax=Succinivibrio dextrinosolvens TaxID=83771 RepID=UPI00241F0C37|nr:cation-translocating P-type ATPase [Succinivibrio dextrinosolvens]MBE6423778.1 cation-translocating P-type ATPase [Succinivibrio dextrinosolvens]